MAADVAAATAAAPVVSSSTTSSSKLNIKSLSSVTKQTIRQ